MDSSPSALRLKVLNFFTASTSTSSFPERCIRLEERSLYRDVLELGPAISI